MIRFHETRMGQTSISKTVTTLVLAIGVLACVPATSNAATVVEYFNDYGASTMSNMHGLAGGSGWNSTWLARSGEETNVMNPGYVANNTSFSNPSYGAGNNLSGSTHGKMNSDPSDDPGFILRRSFDTGLTGTIWASALVRHSSNSSGSALLWFETVQSGYQANTFVGLRSGDQVNMRYKGTNDTGAELNSSGQNLLFLTKIVVDASGSNDTVDFWIKEEGDNIFTEAALGTPLLSNAGQDIFGDQLNYIGISGGSGESVNYDALRYSDEPNAFNLVMQRPIARYEFSDGSTASGDAEANSVATDMTIGSGGENWGFSGSTSTAFARGDTTADSEANAIADNDYFSFTVTPDTGFAMDFTSLEFDTAYNRAGGVSGVVDAFFFVRSSVDGFASNIGPTFIDTFNDVSHSNADLTSRSVDLTAAAFQGLTEATEFRFYIYDESTDANRAARIDNVELIGTVSVPEPATITLLALGLLGLGLYGRRRRKRAA